MSEWNSAEKAADAAHLVPTRPQAKRVSHRLEVGIFGATGGAPSITAGRWEPEHGEVHLVSESQLAPGLSFCLGCKGASLAIDTEAESCKEGALSE